MSIIVDGVTRLGRKDIACQCFDEDLHATTHADDLRLIVAEACNLHSFTRSYSVQILSFVTVCLRQNRSMLKPANFHSPSQRALRNPSCLSVQTDGLLLIVAEASKTSSPSHLPAKLSAILAPTRPVGLPLHVM